MKPTLPMRNTANPQRTTLTHLTDTDELTPSQQEHAIELPAATANPERTVLMDAPAVG